MDFKKFVYLCLFIVYSYALTLKEFNYKMICLVNKERAKKNVPYLAYSSQLANAALKHSKYQASKKKMTHDESGSYSTPMKRIKKAGFNPKACAENVAYNQKTIEKVMESWMNSSGHKKNILNKSYTHFGAGMKDRYWTQNFATSKNGRPKNIKKCP
ncbi:PR-1-like protein [Neocallimastix californiae]|uniref:PR-1-like protein n=1 Tax=Neocallimastix californiae TaxID=1754190 RepID=A0A1Y2ENP8_9FUNG|nr:PR-1-like protein [Neocallimastix californiae]|eukprot:ORY73178.1 PR-1-like protein [Neocallimastix californiae]